MTTIDIRDGFGFFIYFTEITNFHKHEHKEHENSVQSACTLRRLLQCAARAAAASVLGSIDSRLHRVHKYVRLNA